MQAALSVAPPSLFTVTHTKSLVLPWKTMPRIQTPRLPTINASPVANDSSTVDYSSLTSVFPAEACETIGGEACDVEMYPEVKLKSDAPSNKATASSELVDREYLEYNSPKTVFLEEACDDLGGEFCEPDYQTGV